MARVVAMGWEGADLILQTEDGVVHRYAAAEIVAMPNQIGKLKGA
jgi:hypothetical protein